MSTLSRYPRTPQRTPRSGARVLAVFEHLHAIHENVLRANRVLMRLLERGAIGNRRRIEYDDIREHSLFNETAMIEAEICRRQSAQPANGFFQRDHFFIPHVFAKEACEISIRSRMRIRFQEHALRSLRRFIGTE